MLTYTNGGKVGIGTTSPSNTLQVIGSLAGRVPVNVTLEGGAIAIGDYLASSSTPGLAMRARSASAPGIIGVALSPYDGTPIVPRTVQDGIAHEAGHQVMMLVQRGAGSQRAVAQLQAANDQLKARVDQSEANFALLRAAFCVQAPQAALCQAAKP